MESFTCSKCVKSFSYKRSLIKHEKDGSCINNENQKTVIQCPKSECMKAFSCHELYRKHVEGEHNLNLETEDHFFQTYKDFKEWKENFEKRNVCFYFVRSSSKLKNRAKRSYLHCHRSGYYISESKGIRRIKSQGSNKIDSTCTSFMTIIENPTGVYVTCCTTHFGHESNLGRCNLTDDITNHLSNQVADNFESLEKVLVNNDSRSEDEKRKTLLIQKIEIGIGLLSSSEYTTEEYSIMCNKIDSFLDIARKKRKIVDVQNKEPAKKNISKQIRLVSNKKNSKKPTLKPSFSLNEKSAIKKALTMAGK